MKINNLLEAEFTSINPITGERRTFKSTRSKEYRQWQQDIERMSKERQPGLNLDEPKQPVPSEPKQPVPSEPKVKEPVQQTVSAPQSQTTHHQTPTIDTDTSTGGGTWALTVGKQLYDPYHPEYQAKITKIENIDLQDPQQRQYYTQLYNQMGGGKFQAFNQQNGEMEKGEERSKLRLQAINDTRLIPLNAPGKNKFAHAVFIDVYRENTPTGNMVYVFFDNSPTKKWNMNPAPKAGRDNKLSANRLPVNITSIDRKGAGSYWQPFAAHHATAQARDRLEPTNISGIAKHDRDLASINLEINQANRKLVNAIQNPYRISVGNIKKLIQSSRARRDEINKMRSAFPKVKRQYLADLLDVFIKNTGHPEKIYPLVLIDNTAPEKMLAKTGIESTSSITTDFFEIVHPITLVSGNARGNAQKMILEFLGANSYQELMKRSLISYGAKGNTPLVDSYIYARGDDGVIRKLQLSSKSGVGRAASLSSLVTAINEIENNSIASKMFAEINNNPKFEVSLDFINKLILGSKTNIPKYRSAFELADSMDIIPSQDVAVAEKLAKFYKRDGRTFDQEADDTEDSEVDATKFEIPPQLLAEFSSKTIKILNSAPKNSDEFKRLVNGLWLTMADIINKTPEFSQLVTWIFNHSATVQVNTHTDKQDGKLILSNITATWPSQTVDSAELVASGGENINFSISVNGYKQKFGNTGSDLVDRPRTAERDSTDSIISAKDYPGYYSMDIKNTGQLRQLQSRQRPIDDTTSVFGEPAKAWRSMIVGAKDKNSRLWQLWSQIEHKQHELPGILDIIADGGDENRVADHIESII
jgi:hypothetical protein